MKILHPQIVCRLRNGLDSISRVPCHGAFRRDWLPFSTSEETAVFPLFHGCAHGLQSLSNVILERLSHCFPHDRRDSSSFSSWNPKFAPMAWQAFPAPQTKVFALVGEELGCLFPWVFLIPYAKPTLLGVQLFFFQLFWKFLLFTDPYETLVGAGRVEEWGKSIIRASFEMAYLPQNNLC